MVPLVGVEPTQAANRALTGYKSAVLPLNYRGVIEELNHTRIRAGRSRWQNMRSR